MTGREMTLLLTNTTFVLCTLNMTIEVVWVICGEATSAARLRCVVHSQSVLLSLEMYFLAYLVDADDTARNALPRGKFLTVLAAKRAVFLTHRSRVDVSLLRVRDSLHSA